MTRFRPTPSHLHRHFRQSVLLAAALISAVPSQATTIFAVIGKDVIYLAADSKMTYLGETPPTAPKTVCKILRANSYWFAESALANDSKTGFDFDSLAAKTLSNSAGSLAERVQRFDALLKPVLAETVRAIRKDFPAYYTSQLIGKDLVQSVFAGWEDGQPLMVQLICFMQASGNIEHNITFPGKDTANFVMMGHYKAAKQYMDANPAWSSRQPIDMLPFLIQIEIDHAKQEADPPVGPPIALLEIRESSAIWHGRGNCPEVGNR